MVDSILVEDLAVTPPQLWPKRIQRFEVLKRIAAIEMPTARQIDDAAARLKLGRRQFYALLARHRRRFVDGNTSGPKTGCHYSIDPSKEALIREALDRAGPGARLVQVCDEAKRLAIQRGMVAPSETSIRTRFGKTQHGVDLRRRLATRCDWLADTAALDLCVEGPVGPFSAYLFAIVDTCSGAIMHHCLFAGRPSKDDIASAVTVFAERGQSMVGNPQIGLVDSLLGETNGLHLWTNWRAVKGSQARVLLEGSVIRAAVGSKLGRIALRERKTTMSKQGMAPVPLGHAQAVVALVISQRNEGLIGLPLVRQRPNESLFNFTHDRLEQQSKSLGNARQLAAGR